MNNIPPLDLTRQYQQIDSEVSTQVLEILRSGRYIGGAAVSHFEQVFAQYTGTEYSVGCNSGTDALYLALRVLNIGTGDEVITSPFTFIATAEVISLLGAKPVFVDIDPESYNLDVSQLEAAITERTKAIIPVHLFGRPVVMDALMAIAQRHNLPVIEDCAQATGAEWQGQKVGSIGHLGCFSFFPTKNLGACGDGGAITTNNPDLAAQLRMLREHGSKERYIHELIGVNSRLDALQAAILTIKLSHLDQWNEGRSQVAQRYHKLLSPLDTIALPSSPDQGKAVWNQYSIRILAGERDNIRAKLAEQGISTMIYYPIPLHQQPVYQHLNHPPGSFPHSEQVARQILALPMFPELSPSEQERVVDALSAMLPREKNRVAGRL
ncbi:DegT/DnrJ/EryC1/StrS family aminotransferase [Spirulina subsalsa FACHB-351]|uniref:DegT/DnrJ/EryC1/StrS family aminotransferase n=1 Tax=Spirulina subsalsa FACHB-351 TaxID=234711 RepID=A0ABT3L344_9CYAN|nr:DegT/DnrJ/EryC1/StrS family aminotransferase [Spirulina subsalsa]MCW6035921.1 DegT/DnrJ/EryC1/StrS family aminotransferase [Spirulina subsalsa FACHB-351]